MPERSRKRPADVNQLASVIVAEAVGVDQAKEPVRRKNPAAVALGKLGGIKGGKARAAKLTASRKSEIARKAAEARWNERRR